MPDDCVRLEGGDFVVLVQKASLAVFGDENNMRVVQACLGDLGGLRLVVRELPPASESRLDMLVRCAAGLETEITDGKGRKLRR